MTYPLSTPSLLLYEEQLDAIYTASLDAIMVFAEDGSILSANAGASDMFGYTPDELLRLRLVDLMPDEFVAAEMDALRTHGCTQMVYRLNRVMRRTGKNSSGESFPFTAYVRELTSASPKSYIVVAEDNTRIHKSHERITALHLQLQEANQSLEAQIALRTAQLENSIVALNEANRKLALEVREREEIARSLQRREGQLERLLFKERELNELKTRFVSMASHEFRTPLTTMLSSLEVVSMASEDLTPIVTKHLERVRSNIGYLRNVLDDFLQLGKLDLKGVDLNIRTLDLGALLSDLIDDLAIASKPGLDLIVEIEGEFGKTRHLENGLRIILSNLTTNAIKYSPKDTPIRIVVARRDDRMLITVADRGIGVPDACKPHLFERFFRAANAETFQGTGLGLHITQQYVSAMAGTISVTDNPAGTGTVVTVDLPYALV